VQSVLQAFDAGYRERYSLPAVVPWGKAGRAVRLLPPEYSTEILMSALQRFFASHDPWIESTGHSWEAFVSRLPALVTQARDDSAAAKEPQYADQEPDLEPVPMPKSPEEQAHLAALVEGIRRGLNDVHASMGVEQGGHL
jgi:hypothetical protein